MPKKAKPNAAKKKSATPPKKSVAKKKSRSNKAKPTNQRRFLGLAFKLGIVLLILAAMAVAYLDAMITQHFEGKRWAIPAKVYGRPLELYDGLRISEPQLAFELSQLNYRHVAGDQPGPGTFTTLPHKQGGKRYQIHSRGFDFWDGAEPSQRFSMVVSDGKITQLNFQQAGAGIARLEPALIGGIYPAHNEDRVLIKLDQVPQILVQSLLAVEDRDFFSHHGLSFRGIARALMTNLSSGSVKQGGSTLTQQLVKNFYLTSERSLSRKAIEAVMSVLLEFHYDKQVILEAYLNEVYLGQAGKRSIHGIGLASLFYFGQPLRELETHQVALLVGMIKGPSLFDPRRNPNNARQRRDQVLQILLQQGVLDQSGYDREIAKPLSVIKKPLYEDARYPAFLDLLKRQLRQDYQEEDLRSEGLRIFTTLEPWAQQQLEVATDRHLGQLQKKYGNAVDDLQSAGVISSSSGEIVAVVGGKSFRYEGFNRAVDAYRPIGSLAKPAVFLAALEQGYTLASLLQDEPLQHVLPNGDVWDPQNFERESHGEVPLVLALAQSYNQATARLAIEVGVESVAQVITRLGVEKDLPKVPALSLGAVSLSPLEVARMYQTIAAEGFAVPLRTIRSVLTAEGEPLQRYDLDIEQRFDAADMYVLTHGLKQVVLSGTAKTSAQWIAPEIQMAGKTGTSDDQRDSWFAGFTGNYLGVVWVGVDDNKVTPLTGATGAMPILAQAFSALPLEPVQSQQPERVAWYWVDPEKQARTSSNCPNSLYIPMRLDTVPENKVNCGSSRVLNWFKKWVN